MDSEHLFVREEVLPSWWANALGEFLSVSAFNFLLEKLDDTHLAVAAGAGPAAAAIAIQGPWRFVEAPVSRAHPGGAAGTYDIYVTAKANNIQPVPAPYTDDTDYSFALWIGAAGSSPPIVAGSVDLIRRVGSCEWDGTKITRIDQAVPVIGPHAHSHASAGSDPIAPADIGAASATALAAEVTRAEDEEAALAASIAAEVARAESGEAARMPILQPRVSAVNTNVLPWENVSLSAGGTAGQLPDAPPNGTICGVRAGIGITGANPALASSSSANIYLPGRTAAVSQVVLGAPGASILLIFETGSGWRRIGGEEDTGWVDLTLPGSVASGDSVTPGARRINGRVWLRGTLITTGGVGAGGALATVPVGFRPAGALGLPPLAGANAAPSPPAAFQVGADGKITAGAAIAGGVQIGLNSVNYSLV